METKEENLKDNTPENKSGDKGYYYLYEMCKSIRNDSHSASGYLNPITNRLRDIMETLSLEGVTFRFIPFHTHNENTFDKESLKLANVMVDFKAKDSDETVIFTAHHDIANSNSENCQDNTASVCNLIDLCIRLKKLEQEGKLTKNISVGFTDCEEVGGRGMNQLIKEIKSGIYGDEENLTLYALELTAQGENFWVSGILKDSEFHKEIKEKLNKEEVGVVGTPYNESVNARRYGIKACCIGILDDVNMKSALSRGYCDSWALCHSLDDTFEKSADKESMNNFVQDLMKLASVELN